MRSAYKLEHIGGLHTPIANNQIKISIMWSLLAAVVTALVSAGVAVYQNQQQKKLNEHLTGSQEEQNQYNAIQAGIARDFSAAEAQKSRDFTEYMARNKYSMETQSMQDAGVNPAMVYGGGSLVPTAANGAMGSAAQATAAGSGNAGLPQLAGMIEPLMAAIRMPLEMAKLKADVKNTEAQTEGIVLQNYITDSTKDAIIKVTNMEPEEKRATIDKIVQETKSEEVKTQVLGVQLLQDKLDYDQNKRMNELVFQMQKMQNEYQDFVNKHQEKQWNAEYRKICAEVNELYTRAKKNMSDIEVNNAEKALMSAQEGVAKAQQGLIGAQTQTEKVRTTHEAVSTWKDFNDPKAHIVRSVVDPMNWLHEFKEGGKNNVLGGVKNFWDETKQQWRKGNDEGPYGKHSFESHDEFLREQAEDIMTLWSTFGQAYEEYGSIE